MLVKSGERYFLYINNRGEDTRMQLAPYEDLRKWEKDGSIVEGDKVLIIQVGEIIEYDSKIEIVKDYSKDRTEI